MIKTEHRAMLRRVMIDLSPALVTESVALPPSSHGMECAMSVRRNRFKPYLSLNDRLRLFSDQLKAAAAKLRPGPEQDALLMRARLADTASHIDEWASSPGLQPPK
jgi:hypothetical protein